MSSYQGRRLYPQSVWGRRHPRAGRPHPFLYAGARNRRTRAHAYYGTQPTGYGLRGGDPRFSGVSGDPRRVYQHGLAGAMRPQRGTGYRTSHQLGHYRRGLSKAGKDAYANFMGGRTRKDFGSAKEFRQARSQARRERSQARREYASGYRNPYTGTKHRRFTKVSHRDPGTGIRRNYFGGFTGNLSKGSRNLINKRRKQLQKASQRYQWGVKNPGLTNISLGGYRYMSPKFHKRREAAQRGEQTIKQLGGMLGGLRGWYQKAQQERRGRQLKANQALWRSELRGLSVPRRTTHTFTPDDPMYFTGRQVTGPLKGYQIWGKRKSNKWGLLGKTQWQWNRPPGKTRTYQQSINPAFVSSKPFGWNRARRTPTPIPLPSSPP